MRWYVLLRALGCVRDSIRPAGSSTSLAELENRAFNDSTDSSTESCEPNPTAEVTIQPTLFRIPSEASTVTEVSLRCDNLASVDVDDIKYTEIRSNPEAISRLEDLLYPDSKLYNLPIWKAEPHFTSEFVEQVREYQMMKPKYPFPIPATSSLLLTFMNYHCNDWRLIRSLLHLCKREPVLLGDMKDELPIDRYHRFIKAIPFEGDQGTEDLWSSLCDPEVASISICELTVRETLLLPLLERSLTSSFERKDILSCLQLAGFRDFTILCSFYQNQYFGMETARLVYIILRIAEVQGWNIVPDIYDPLAKYEDFLIV